MWVIDRDGTWEETGSGSVVIGTGGGNGCSQYPVHGVGREVRRAGMCAGILMQWTEPWVLPALAPWPCGFSLQTWKG